VKLFPLFLLAPAMAFATPRPIDMTFRWAGSSIECQSRGVTRSNMPSCSDVTAPYVVVAQRDASDPRIRVERYAGKTATGKPVWVNHVDLGKGVTPLTVLLHKDTVFVAATANGGYLYAAALEAATGKVIDRVEVLNPSGGFKGAMSVQAIASDHLMLYSITPKDAWVASLDFKLKVTGTRMVPLDHVRPKMVKGTETAATAADGGATATIRGGNFVVARGGKTVEVPHAGATMVSVHATPDRTIVVGHSAIASGAEAYALEAKSGKVLWRRGVSGLGPVSHSKYHNRVITLVDKDLLVVQGIESHGAYICTLDVARGTEHVCYDHLNPSSVLP
jgi:hypothetical protein